MIATIPPDILGQAFFFALFLSLAIVPATIRLAREVGAVDVPKARSSHTMPTTRLGGLGIVFSLIVPCLLFLPLNAFAWAFLSGLMVIVITGVLDDILDIGPRWKMIGQTAAAAIFVLLDGGTLSHLGDFLGSGEITLGLLAIPFTIFCMVGGMNAFNLSDGLDGLAAGMAAIAAAFFAYFSWHSGAADLLVVCMALLGAAMGFLRYNSYPAKLFMGDCGSLALGYVLAALLVSGSQREGAHVPLVAWATVVALPLLDTLLVMVRRIRNGQSPFLADRTHLHHRLMALGLDHPGAVAVMYAAMVVFGALALAGQEHPDWFRFAALCLSGVALFSGVAMFQRNGFLLNSGLRTSGSTALSRSLPETPANGGRMSALLLSLLCLPALTFPLPELSRGEALALFMLAGVVAFYSLHRAHIHKGMLHGAIYVSILALFFFYNLAADTEGHWLCTYLTVISVLAAAWVAVRIIRHGYSMLMTSGAELLTVFLSWFLPFVLLPELHLSASVAEAGQRACLQVLPFMLAVKIHFHLQPQGNALAVNALIPARVVAVGRLARLRVRALLLAARISFDLPSQGNRLVAGVLSGSMAVVALRGFLL